MRGPGPCSFGVLGHAATRLFRQLGLLGRLRARRIGSGFRGGPRGGGCFRGGRSFRGGGSFYSGGSFRGGNLRGGYLSRIGCSVRADRQYFRAID